MNKQIFRLHLFSALFFVALGSHAISHHDTKALIEELTKRIITSLFLISLLSLVFFNSYILIISLIVISIIVLIEFYRLISKIFNKNTFKINFLKLSIKFLSLIYLTFFSVLIFEGISS